MRTWAAHSILAFAALPVCAGGVAAQEYAQSDIALSEGLEVTDLEVGNLREDGGYEVDENGVLIVAGRIRQGSLLTNPDTLQQLVNPGGGTLQDRINSTGQIVGGEEGDRAAKHFLPIGSPLRDVTLGRGHTPAAQDCIAAAKEVMVRENAINRIAGNNGEAAGDLRTQVTQMANACFTPIWSADPGPEADFFRRGAIILKRQVSNGATYCSGFLLSDRTLATARHCLFEDTSALNVSQLSVMTLSADGWIQVKAGPGYADSDGNALPRPTNSTDDFVLLELNAPVPGMADFKAELAGAHDIEAARNSGLSGQFFQLGYQSLIAIISTFPKDSLSLFRESVVADKGQYCIAFQYSDDCVFQGCQSLQQSSGSAFFVRTPSGWRLAGVLHGAASDSKGNRADYERCFANPQSLSLDDHKALVGLNITARPR